MEYINGKRIKPTSIIEWVFRKCVTCNSKIVRPSLGLNEFCSEKCREEWKIMKYNFFLFSKKQKRKGLDTWGNPIKKEK